MKDEDYWIHKDPDSEKLFFRFRVRGFSKQFYLSTGLKDTKRNREIVRSRRDAIATDITLERFDPTLNSYRFRTSKIELASPPPPQLNLQQLWEKFTEFKSTQLEETSILGKYKPISNYIRKLPTQDLAAAAAIRD
ncbi:MAG: Arm DNA-binding domain-containing protein, partial [Nostoc sp.]